MCFLHSGGQYEIAGRLSREVLAEHPDEPEALAILGAVLGFYEGEPAQGIGLIEQACGLRPGMAHWRSNLAGLYRRQGRLADALREARKAVALSPDQAVYHLNLARIQLDLDDEEAAQAAVFEALARDRDHVESHLLLGEMLLRRGEMRAGWRELEWLDRTNTWFRSLPKMTVPKWSGMRLGRGRLLLIADQGFGDVIQFSRFIPTAAELCHEVMVICDPALVGVLARVRGVTSCVSQWEALPPITAWTRLSRLPWLFGTDQHTIPAPDGRAMADPGRAGAWRKRILGWAGGKGLRVGLAWAGNPRHANDHRRSMPLASLAPLLATPGACFVALQRFTPERDQAFLATAPNLLDVSAELSDFGETAAAIEALDLVITIDSAVAHLAGTLGKEACVLLPEPSDWRWMRQRTDTPWYPSLRLFRQPASGEWLPVIRAVTRNLAARLPLTPLYEVAPDNRSMLVSTRMTVHVVQHGLQDQHSHYFNDTLSWREALLKLGLPWNCYANRRLAEQHRRETGAVPTFRIAPDAVIERDPSLRRLADFIDIAEVFAEDCRRTFGNRLNSNELVLVPYAAEHEIFGAALWLGTLPKASHPRLAFIVHRPDFSWSIDEDRTEIKGDTSFWRYAGRRLLKVTETIPPFIGVPDQRFSVALANILGMSVRHIPMPSPTPNVVSAPTLTRSQCRFDIDFGLVGEFRPERGSQALPRLLAQVACGRPDLRILLHVRNQGQKDEFIRLFSEYSAQVSLEVLVGDLQPADFQFNMMRCGMLILPYSPDRYRMRPSGILSDAASLGIPVMVPNKTWMSDRILDGSASGIIYDTLSLDTLQAAVDMPGGRKRKIREKAGELAASWKQRHSTDNVLSVIFQHFAPAEVGAINDYITEKHGKLARYRSDWNRDWRFRNRVEL